MPVKTRDLRSYRPIIRQYNASRVSSFFTPNNDINPEPTPAIKAARTPIAPMKARLSVLPGDISISVNLRNDPVTVH